MGSSVAGALVTLLLVLVLVAGCAGVAFGAAGSGIEFQSPKTLTTAEDGKYFGN